MVLSVDRFRHKCRATCPSPFYLPLLAPMFFPAQCRLRAQRRVYLVHRTREDKETNKQINHFQNEPPLERFWKARRRADLDVGARESLEGRDVGAGLDVRSRESLEGL